MHYYSFNASSWSEERSGSEEEPTSSESLESPKHSPPPLSMNPSDHNRQRRVPELVSNGEVGQHYYEVLETSGSGSGASYLSTPAPPTAIRAFLAAYWWQIWIELGGGTSSLTVFH